MLKVPDYKGCVVYAIWNNITEDFYVGSAKNFRDRIQKHNYDLKSRTHHNKNLVDAIKTYGYDNFDVFILRKSEIYTKLDDEQWAIDITNPTYNISRSAYDTTGVKRDKEALDKMKIYANNRTDTHKFNHIQSIRNNKDMIDKAKARCPSMCENNKVPIYVTDIISGVKTEYPSIKEAYMALGIKSPQIIRYGLTGRAKKLYKNQFKFEYKYGKGRKNRSKTTS